MADWPLTRGFGDMSLVIFRSHPGESCLGAIATPTGLVPIAAVAVTVCGLVVVVSMADILLENSLVWSGTA